MPFSLRGLLLAAVLLAPPSWAQDAPPVDPVTERGVAARYATGATGSATASGEPYNPERLTIAHPTLPFGTLVQLTNLANGQSVTARVNDRAPASGTLRVRVSARAADHLGLGAQPGEVVLALNADELALLDQRAAREKARQARLDAAKPAAEPEAEGRSYTVQLASFSDERRAVVAADAIRGAWVQPVVIEGATVYRVCFGVFSTLERAEGGRMTLLAQGHEGFVKTLDVDAARSGDRPVRPASTGN